MSTNDDLLERINPVRLRLEAARRLGCEVIPLDPETGRLNEIRLGSKQRVLVGGLSPLNDAVAARLVGDKHFTGLALANHGYRTPRTVRCLQPGYFRDEDYSSHTGIRPAVELAHEVGFPLVIKPNGGSRGIDIAVVEDAASLEAAVEQVWRRNYLALAQQPIPGFDLRIDFLDGEFLFGYTRQPVRVVGDGRRPLRELFADLDPRMRGEGFETHLANDPIWQRQTTERPELSLGSVLAQGETLGFETPILNLNRLCVGQRLETLSQPWTDFGLAIGRVLSLRHFGIDLKIESMDQDPTVAVVIEVNSSPSLVPMARIGHLDAALEAERKIVTAILDHESYLERLGAPPA